VFCAKAGAAQDIAITVASAITAFETTECRGAGLLPR
jgi:hypothetical protein